MGPGMLGTHQLQFQGSGVQEGQERQQKPDQMHSLIHSWTHSSFRAWRTEENSPPGAKGQRAGGV